MNLVRIGSRTINLGLVIQILEPSADPDLPIGSGLARRLELSFVNGSTTALEGEEAEALRRYLMQNSASLNAAPSENEFSTGATLFPKAASREEGAR